MFLIAGLGNPDKKYEKTRHNIGFDTVDALAEKYNISITEKKHKALCGSGVIEGVKVILAKPQTYRKRHDGERKGDSCKASNLYEFKRRKHRRNREFL